MTEKNIFQIRTSVRLTERELSSCCGYETEGIFSGDEGNYYSRLLKDQIIEQLVIMVEELADELPILYEVARLPNGEYNYSATLFLASHSDAGPPFFTSYAQNTERFGSHLKSVGGRDGWQD